MIWRVISTRSCNKLCCALFPWESLTQHFRWPWLDDVCDQNANCTVPFWPATPGQIIKWVMLLINVFPEKVGTVHASLTPLGWAWFVGMCDSGLLCPDLCFRCFIYTAHCPALSQMSGNLCEIASWDRVSASFRLCSCQEVWKSLCHV